LDAATIDAARAGDREACAALLGALQDPWYRTCMSLLGGDAERARDATQETALRFLRQLPGFRGESQIRTWSLGIAINVVREMRRARRGDSVLPEEPGVTDGRRAVPGGPEEAVEASERRDVLRATLADLPDRQREAVVLRFFEDLSVEETAAAMACAPGTVKATVHQALRKLKEKLKQLA
jgi:RNA polymerase sigma-70 factor (ECF subfamily)